jgi:hypothetical protein
MRVDVVRPNAFFLQVLMAAAKQEKRPIIDLSNSQLFGMDPGETTGCARLKVVSATELMIELFQWETKDIGQSFVMLRDYLEQEGVTRITRSTNGRLTTIVGLAFTQHSGSERSRLQPM